MTGRNRRNFSAEFRLEAAQLVLDQHYTVATAATAMNVGKSTMDKWGRQLKEERAGKSPIASPMTPEQIEIRELKKKLQRVEMERDRLKKATALLMSDSLNSSHELRNSGRGFLLPLCATCLGFIAAVINTGGSQKSLMPHGWHYSVLSVKVIAKVTAPQTHVILPRWSRTKV